ncbi:MAG: tetratricopeptide repeat protein [Elusimicrobia bacterium]|nr:tetratricopeptide repeat protein [Elusimicrobiota bacterium]
MDSGFLSLAVLLALAPSLAAARATPQITAEEEAFNAAAQMYQETGRDKMAVIQAFENFISQFAQSPRVSDAYFMVGEAYLDQALSILKSEASTKKSSAARLLAPRNPAAAGALENARKAFSEAAGDKKSGLGPSALYRLGEVSYNDKDWSRAVEDFHDVERRFPKAYIVPESLLGVIYADLALEEFSQAEANLFLLGETYPVFLKEPLVLYAQGIVSLHKGDYSAAEATLKQVKTAEAQYYLGKTYLLSKRAYLAAAAFENLIRDYPESDLKEEAQFFIGDSFFLAEDFDGAISKYQKFLSLYPDSPLRVSAMFRIGSSCFQKKDLVEARANFQSVLDRYPKDFFAPLAQYFIAESYLVAGQVREAMFAYTKVITQYPETIRISPLAHFKLAWTGYQVGDYTQAVQTCNNFVTLYPNSALAKNVYLVMGNALIKLKRYQEATAALQRIIDLAPSSEIAEQALFTILKNQFDQKAYNSILTSYQFIFRHLPPSKSKWRSMSYLYAAEAYLSLNQTEEARVIYEMILKVYPDDPAAFFAQDGLAWASSYQGEDDRALQERKKLKDMLAAESSTFSFSGLNELGIADSLYNQKSYDDAFQLYSKFVDNNPKAAEAPAVLYRAGMSLYHQRYYTQAIETWRKLQARYPQAKETGEASAQIADTLFRAQKYDEAIAAYRDIIANYPQSEQLPMAYLRIAQSAFNSRNDDAAVKQIKELVTRFPKASEATDGLDLLEGIFDRNKSMNYKTLLRELIAAGSANAIAGEAQFRLARRCFEAKDFAAAATGFQKFSVDFTNNPQLVKAQFYLGESYFSQNDYTDAIPAYERLLNNFDKDDDTPLALFHLASANYALKKYEEAVKYYTRLSEEYPKVSYAKETEFNLALAYKALGKTDLSQYSYQKYIELVGDSDPLAQSALWEIFSLQKDRRDYEGALATLQHIQDHAKPGSDTVFETTYRMGEVSSANNRPDEAMNMWVKLQGLKPANNPFRLDALIKLGEAYEKASDNERAVAVYEDLARNAGREIAQSAAARAAALRRSGRGGKGAAAAPPEPAPKKAAAMPALPKRARRGAKAPAAAAGPEPAPAPAPAAPAPAAQEAPAQTTKALNLPGMTDGDGSQ